MKLSKILAAMLSCGMIAVSAEAQNLLLNPGFESGQAAPWEKPADVTPFSYYMSVGNTSTNPTKYLDPTQAPNFVVVSSPNDATGVPGHYANAFSSYPAETGAGSIRQAFIAPCDGVYAFGGYANRNDAPHYWVGFGLAQQQLTGMPVIKIYNGPPQSIGTTLASQTIENISTDLSWPGPEVGSPEWYHAGGLVTLQMGQIYTYEVQIGSDQRFDEAYVRNVSGCADNCCCSDTVQTPADTSTWGGWLDYDNPGANGDFETVAMHQDHSGVCAAPTDIECRIKSTGAPASTSGQTITCDIPSGGFSCVNSQNPGQCLDYEVRYKCP